MPDDFDKIIIASTAVHDRIIKETDQATEYNHLW